MKDFNLKGYLAENKLLKEAIDFPELEDEFEGYQDAMLGSDEEYLQGVIDAAPEEFLDLNGGYYEVALGIEQGRYNAEEAVKLAKAWAQDKLSGLAENKLVKENEDDGSQYHINQIDDDLMHGEFDSYEDVVGYLDNIIKGIERLKIQQKQVFQDMENDEYDF